MARPEIEPKTPLAMRLRQIRKAVGDPDRSILATRIGVSKNSLAAYERGENEPVASALSAYVTEYGVSSGWLLTGKGEMFATEPETVFAGELDRERFEVAIEAVEEGLKQAGKTTTPETKAKLFLAAYEILSEPDQKDNVIRLVTAA